MRWLTQENQISLFYNVTGVKNLVYSNVFMKSIFIVLNVFHCIICNLTVFCCTIFTIDVNKMDEIKLLENLFY